MYRKAFNICLIYMQYTIEEKVIERAYKKLALDALVIQQGRLAEQKGKQSYFKDFVAFPVNAICLFICLRVSYIVFS